MGDSMGTEAALAQDLKVFRKQFRMEHGRDPSRKDMNKHPAIAATYDEWLALKSSQSRPSGSSSSSSSYKRKAVDEPNYPAAGRSNAAESSTSSMPPPPTTPSKKKPRQRITSEQGDLFKTPTKRNGIASKQQSPGASSSVHDSGGSIIDVPLSPKEVIASPSLSRKQKANTRAVVYESPTKIRDLLSSFSSIHRTPTKNVAKEMIGKLKGGTMPAYTPRTKARKRLRGEVVITPEKASVRANGVVQGSADIQPSVQPVQKKRRGMAASTLMDYGIVSVAGPRSKVSDVAKGGGIDKAQSVQTLESDGQNRGVEEDEEEDEDDDDDMLGPSPSMNRVVDRPVKTYQPLFGVKTNGSLTDEVERDDIDDIGQLAQSNTTKQSTTKAAEREDVNDEEQDFVVVPYQPYKKGKAKYHSPADSDDDEDGMQMYDAMISAAAVDESEATSPPRDTSPIEEEGEEEESPSLLDTLSLHSPQCKRANNKRRIKAEKSVRHLIGTDESLAILDEWDENEGDKVAQGADTKKEAASKSNKVGPAIKGGRLMKSAKNFKPVLSNGKAKESEEKSRREKQSNLIFGNVREQLGSDQDSDIEGIDEDSDEWASEVDSADYGLGDGYMSE